MHREWTAEDSPIMAWEDGSHDNNDTDRDRCTSDKNMDSGWYRIGTETRPAS